MLLEVKTLKKKEGKKEGKGWNKVRIRKEEVGWGVSASRQLLSAWNGQKKPKETLKLAECRLDFDNFHVHEVLRSG